MSYHPPQPAIPADAEQLGFEVGPKSLFDQMFLAFRRAHYSGMQPRDEGHKRFIKKELRGIEREQNLQRGYTKII